MSLEGSAGAAGNAEFLANELYFGKEDITDAQ
jgi:hypothetical protein